MSGSWRAPWESWSVPDRLRAGYVLLVGAILALLGPRLLAAREALTFPTVSTVSGVPVAWHGFYFFTGLSLVAALWATRRRGAKVWESAVLAVAGLGAFEFVYGVSFALTTGQYELLTPVAGLPSSGWDGYATWLFVELLVASLVLVGADRAGVDRAVLLAGAVFVLGLTYWDLELGWNCPPYDNRLSVFIVNSLTEVAGTLWLPLLVTAIPRAADDPLERWGRQVRPLLGRPRHRGKVVGGTEEGGAEGEGRGPAPSGGPPGISGTTPVVLESFHRSMGGAGTGRRGNP